MTDEEFNTIVKTNSEYRYSEVYCMYINSDATVIWAPDTRGKYGGFKWKIAHVRVDERTGYRYIYRHKKRLSILRILQTAWGPEYSLPKLSQPPMLREEWNDYQKSRKNSLK